jgi:hypothetical protein
LFHYLSEFGGELPAVIHLARAAKAAASATLVVAK